jgi:hypothetical protein
MLSLLSWRRGRSTTSSGVRTSGALGPFVQCRSDDAPSTFTAGALEQAPPHSQLVSGGVRGSPCMTTSTGWPRIGPATHRAATQEDGLRREASPQVEGSSHSIAAGSEVGPRTLSRWRHGFEPRWDYAGQSPYSGSARPHRRATRSPPVIPVCGLAHLTRDISMVAMYETSPMVRTHPRSVLRRT